MSPVSTFAGGQYTLNFTDDSGNVQLGTGWTNTKVSSSVHSTDPIAVYQINNVLLPEAIFGTDIPPTPAPAPAPAPVVAPPAADTPAADVGSGSSSPGTAPPGNSCGIIRWSVWRQLGLVVLGGLALFL